MSRRVPPVATLGPSDAPPIPAAARDGHDHVVKGASMALRATGKRNRTLHSAARSLAADLAGRADTAAFGREVLRDLASAATARRLGL